MYGLQIYFLIPKQLSDTSFYYFYSKIEVWTWNGNTAKQKIDWYMIRIKGDKETEKNDT